MDLVWREGVISFLIQAIKVKLLSTKAPRLDIRSIIYIISLFEVIGLNGIDLDLGLG